MVVPEPTTQQDEVVEVPTPTSEQAKVVEVEEPASATVPAKEQVKVVRLPESSNKQKKVEGLAGQETVPNIRSRLRPRNKK